MIYVYSCEDHKKFVAIFLDKDLNIPMANPIVTDQDGEYVYFSNRLRVYEKIFIDGKQTGVVDGCKVDRNFE